MKQTYVYSHYQKNYTLCPVKKYYPLYDVCICKVESKYFYTCYYAIIDIKSGLQCGKTFKKLKDAIEFMNDTEDENFIDWFNRVTVARSTAKYVLRCASLSEYEFFRRGLSHE